MSQPLLGNIYWIYQIDASNVEDNKNLCEWDNVYLYIVKVKVTSLHLRKMADAFGIADYDNSSFNHSKDFCIPFEKFFDSKEEAEKAAKIELKERIAEIEKKIAKEQSIAERYKSCINSYCDNKD